MDNFTSKNPLPDPHCGWCSSPLVAVHVPKYTADMWECPKCEIQPQVVTYQYFPTKATMQPTPGYRSFIPVGEVVEALEKHLFFNDELIAEILKELNLA